MKLKYIISGLFYLTVSQCYAQERNLDYYLTNATANSPVLNDLRNQILSARIDSQILLASTRLLVTAGGNSFFAPSGNGFGYDRAITNGGQLQGVVTATKNLIPHASLRLQYMSLKFQIDSLNAARGISEQDLRKAIIAQYITTYGDQLQVQFNKELHSMLSKEDTALKTLTRQNVYRQVDYLSFLITYEQLNLTRLQLEHQFKNDYATLNYLAGIIDTSALPLQRPEFNLNDNFNFDNSIFITKFRTDSLKLINNSALINAGYRPKISLYADGGYLSTFSFEGYKNFGASAGINLSIPIYDGHQRRLQLSKITLAEKTRQKNKEFFTNQYHQQIAQLKQQLLLIDELTSSINKQMNYIQTLVDADMRLLQTGDIKITDLVLAINNYINIKGLNVQNIVSRMQIINQINYWNR